MHGQVGSIPSPNANGMEKGSRQDEKHGAMPTCDDHRQILLGHSGTRVDAIFTHDAIVSPFHARHTLLIDSIEVGNGDEHRRHSTRHAHGRMRHTD